MIHIVQQGKTQNLCMAMYDLHFVVFVVLNAPYKLSHSIQLTNALTCYRFTDREIIH